MESVTDISAASAAPHTTPRLEPQAEIGDMAAPPWSSAWYEAQYNANRLETHKQPANPDGSQEHKIESKEIRMESVTDISAALATEMGDNFMRFPKLARSFRIEFLEIDCVPSKTALYVGDRGSTQYGCADLEALKLIGKADNDDVSTSTLQKYGAGYKIVCRHVSMCTLTMSVYVDEDGDRFVYFIFRNFLGYPLCLHLDFEVRKSGLKNHAVNPQDRFLTIALRWLPMFANLSDLPPKCRLARFKERAFQMVRSYYPNDDDTGVSHVMFGLNQADEKATIDEERVQGIFKSNYYRRLDTTLSIFGQTITADGFPMEELSTHDDLVVNYSDGLHWTHRAGQKLASHKSPQVIFLEKEPIHLSVKIGGKCADNAQNDPIKVFFGPDWNTARAVTIDDIRKLLCTSKLKPSFLWHMFYTDARMTQLLGVNLRLYILVKHNGIFAKDKNLFFGNLMKHVLLSVSTVVRRSFEASPALRRLLYHTIGHGPSNTPHRVMHGDKLVYDGYASLVSKLNEEGEARSNRRRAQALAKGSSSSSSSSSSVTTGPEGFIEGAEGEAEGDGKAHSPPPATRLHCEPCGTNKRERSASPVNPAKKQKQKAKNGDAVGRVEFTTTHKKVIERRQRNRCGVCNVDFTSFNDVVVNDFHHTIDKSLPQIDDQVCGEKLCHGCHRLLTHAWTKGSVEQRPVTTEERSLFISRRIAGFQEALDDLVARHDSGGAR